jgi:predicted HicB family RNase H-like nuclease
MSIREDAEAVKLAAQDLYCQDPDWVTFYREIMGLRGAIRRRFRSRETLDKFEKTAEFLEIQRMLSRLRAKGPVAANPKDPTQIITVRIPNSLREALRLEAFEHCTSINKLCISKLVQFIDRQMIPAETSPPSPKGPIVPKGVF